MTEFLKQFIIETYIRNKDLKTPKKRKVGKRKLSADMEVGEWIHDFVHSKSNRFKGKDKKTRIQMALGAWYGAQKQDRLEAPMREKGRKKKSLQEARVKLASGQVLKSKWYSQEWLKKPRTTKREIANMDQAYRLWKAEKDKKGSDYANRFLTYLNTDWLDMSGGSETIHNARMKADIALSMDKVNKLRKRKR